MSSEKDFTIQVSFHNHDPKIPPLAHHSKDHRKKSMPMQD